MVSNACYDALLQTTLENVIITLVWMACPTLLEQCLCFWETSGCLTCCCAMLQR